MTQPRKNFHRAALCAATALLWCAFSQVSRGQSPANTLQTDLAGATSREDAIHKGLLFSAVAPVTEDALKRLDGTPNEQSFTVPLTVDRVHNRLYVQAKINNKSVRLILDTGGGINVGLDATTAKGIKLNDQNSVEAQGAQGTETETSGLAQSLTVGNLTLQKVLVNVTRSLLNTNTLGIQVFANYRVTLDFAAQTMTLVRGGRLRVPSGGEALSLPFDDVDGYIFVPIHVLDQDGWALLDSGSFDTITSLKAAKTGALHLPASDAETAANNEQLGLGDTEKKITVLTLKVPIPISINADHGGTQFSTTSLGGASAIDDALNNQFNSGGSINALLGFPFFVQFQRVIIDYPSRTLVLQYPVKDTPLKVAGLTAKHDRAWPGYKWLQKGYAWNEVPDGSAPPASAPVQINGTTINGMAINGMAINGMAINGMAINGATATSGGTVVTMGNGSVTVTTNGVTKVYPVPPGSGTTINPDGSVHILPPGAVNPAR